MPIPPQKIPVSLSSAIPSEMTVDKLKKQLDDIGLTCEAADPERLKEYIKDVRNKIPHGSTQSLMILKPTMSAENALSGLATNLTISSIGNWTPNGTYGYQQELEYIQYKEHFDWLKANRSSFTGNENNPPQFSGTESTVEAIKEQFVKIAYTASSTLIIGLDKSTMESVFSNAISPVQDSNAKDYDVPDSRVIFLVENYNPQGNDGEGEADGIGVLTVDWTLTIKDYKKKKQSLKHKWTLEVNARSVLYSSLGAMYADYNAAKANFKSNSFALLKGIPPQKTKVEVFDSIPPANQDTFHKSLPVVSKEDYVDVIVLYAPDLQKIGSIDNTHSSATSTWQKSITSGFTFSTTQTLSITANFEVTVEVVKAGVSIGLSVSFTEQWSRSSTETISFTVPQNQISFTYQGYMISSILRYEPSSNTFRYIDTAQFLTSVIATSENPILTAN